jgi:ribosomal protein S18 acetylase RimI-like enzyme
MTVDYTIRKAKPTDLDIIVKYTLQEAFEAEGIEPNAAGVTRGVQAGLNDPSLAVYWVVEDSHGLVIASTSIVTEWSNFHGANYWWIQSIFIVPEHRGRGVVELILDHLAEEAERAGALDLRLYAHNANQRALKAYRRCGFNVAPYSIMKRCLTDD